MSKFALIIPTYNSAKTVVETLRSILALGDELKLLKKVVITDDGSKDNTLELVRETWNSTTPLEILKTAQNQGEYMNVNSAVMSLEPEVEWYLMMHSDNLAKKGWVETLVNEATRADKKVGSICTSYDNLYLNGKTVPGEDAGRTVNFEGNSHSVYYALRIGCWWHNSTAIVRVSAFKEVGGMPAKQDLAQMGDWDFSLRLLASNWGITYIEKPYVVYVENESSVSSKNFVTHRDLKDRMAVTKRFAHGCPKELLNLIFGDISKMLLRRIVSSLLHGQWKRLWAGATLLPKVLTTYLYTLKLGSATLQPLRHPVLFEKRWN